MPLDRRAREAHTDNNRRNQERRGHRPEITTELVAPPGPRDAAAPGWDTEGRRETDQQGNGSGVNVTAVATDVATFQPMTRADRDNLARLARGRGKLAKSGIAARCAALRSDVEEQLSARYEFTDERWASITGGAQKALALADAQVAAACRASGIPENLRPSLNMSWHGRGENALAARRAELRKLAESRITEMARAADLRIAESVLDVETELVRAGLDSTAAAQFLDAMPTPDQLLPQIDVAELSPSGAEPRDRWRSWEPPAGAAAALMQPRTGRQARRDAIADAIAATPDASDREIARIAGADHKTVAAVRGESPQAGGETPQQFPTDTAVGGVR